MRLPDADILPQRWLDPVIARVVYVYVSVSVDSLIGQRGGAVSTFRWQYRLKDRTSLLQEQCFHCRRFAWKLKLSGITCCTSVPSQQDFCLPSINQYESRGLLLCTPFRKCGD